RDLRAPDHEARPELDAAGDLAASRGARVGGPRRHQARGQIQVPLLQSPAAAPHRRALAPQEPGGSALRITLTSVVVDDPQKSLEFYTQRLGFVKQRACSRTCCPPPRSCWRYCRQLLA